MNDVNSQPGSNPSENTGQQQNPNEAVYSVIAARVRDDSSKKGRLTSVRVLSTLTGDPEKSQAFLRGIAGNELYKDIKLIIAGTGATYLFSETSINRKDAEKLANDEDIRQSIAGKVRKDSSKDVRLTPLHSLGLLIPGAEIDNIDRHLMFLLDDERYKDLHIISNSRGTRFLYSSDSMTDTYARVMARTEANNPIATIVETVREESRVYPRPTRLDSLIEPIFKLDENEIEHYLDEIQKKPDCADIKLARASNGVAYLYSESYLDPRWVRATIEWDEVGSLENP